MNRIERWFLKRLCRKLAIQGAHHKSRIIMYYEIMYRAACEEFREDNKPTIDDFLTECHELGMKHPDWWSNS